MKKDVLLYGLFGWRAAVLYTAAGLTLAVVAGFVLGRMRLEGWVEQRHGPDIVMLRLDFIGQAAAVKVGALDLEPT